MPDQNTEKDHWDSTDYQHSASFVPKLAGKVVQWLDLQPDDVVLDVGCGDGILNLEFAKILAQGTGSQHGIDSSTAMIQSAKTLCKDSDKTTFEVLDAGQVSNLQPNTYNKIFSNAALHWILRNPSTRKTLFPHLATLLPPGGTLALEMGGQGNVAEMRSALYSSLLRHVSLDVIQAADPWFFPDEVWLRGALESAGFEVLKCEREWRPTRAAEGGVEGWVKLFGSQLLDVVDGEVREEVVRECGKVLGSVCKGEEGGWWIGYVRLRALARKR